MHKSLELGGWSEQYEARHLNVISGHNGEHRNWRHSLCLQGGQTEFSLT